MIGNCPANWIDEHEKAFRFYDLDDSKLCKRIPNSLGHTFQMDWPVLSLDTNRTYANIYCAECNADAAHLVKWNASIECTKEINFEEFDVFNSYKALWRQWILNDGDVICRFVIREFHDFESYIKVVCTIRNNVFQQSSNHPKLYLNYSRRIAEDVCRGRRKHARLIGQTLLTKSSVELTLYSFKFEE